MKRGKKGRVVPNHKEVKVGTVNGVLRQAEISPKGRRMVYVFQDLSLI
jgi:hypothetical protein